MSEKISEQAPIKDQEKSKEDLIRELADARTKISELEYLRDEVKRIENVMRQAVIMASEEKARTEAIIESMGEGISVQDLNFRVLLQNQFHKDMVGDHVGEFCYKAYQNKDSVCDGCHIALSYEDGQVHSKEQFRATDHGVFYYEITSSPLKDKDGRIIAGVEAVRDITHRKKTEQSLLETEAKFRNLVECSFVGIYIVQDSEIVYANPRFCEIFDFNQDEIFLKPLRDLIAEENRQAVEQNIRRCLAGESRTINYSFKGKKKDGAVIDIEAQGVATEFGGKPGVLGTLIDITESRRLQQEVLKSQKLESLGLLAAGIAHEFNNALTAISGNIFLAKMYAKPESELADILNEAEKASRRAEQLTQELLVFSKGGTMFKEVVDLPAILAEVAAEQAYPGVTYNLSTAPDLWTVEADGTQFRQAIINIIINARESMPAGGTVSITAENLDPLLPLSLPFVRPGRHVRISIGDQGIGIEETHIEKIFEPFFTTKEKGSGLGLATAFSILRGHEGFITVESTKGSGTMFRVYVPAGDSPPRPDTGRRVSVGKRRVLIMDDEEMVRMVAERMLNQCGCDATFAANGEEMLRKYQEALDAGSPFDAVIVDLIIESGMGGKEAIARLLELDPAAKAIVSSGYADDKIMANFAEYGFKGVLPKPYQIPKLNKVLHDVLIGPLIGPS